VSSKQAMRGLKRKNAMGRIVSYKFDEILTCARKERA
jgi:hypothetical protein